jgi:hypothetical protein
VADVATDCPASVPRTSHYPIAVTKTSEVMVFPLSDVGLFNFEHSHGDNDWHRMHEVKQARDPASADPEREWSRHRIFRCDSCAEEIRVELPEQEPRG